MQQLPTFNFGLTKNFFFIYRTLSMRQKTKNYRIRGSNDQKFFFLFYFPSHIPIWVWFVQKTRAKNSHAWAPLKVVGNKKLGGLRFLQLLGNGHTSGTVAIDVHFHFEHAICQCKTYFRFRSLQQNE